MKILYAGCNIFGQIIDCDNITIDSFTDLQLHLQLKNEPAEDDCFNFRISHTFNILQISKKKIKLFGHGFSEKTTHTVTDISLPNGNLILDISASDTKILVLNDIGEIFVLDLLERPIGLQKRQGLFVNDLDECDKIVQIANGMTINVAVSKKGKIFSIPNLLSYKGDVIATVCCGYEHCLILDKTGSVYSFGSNSRGQLGLGHLNSESDPVLVETLAGIRVTQIAAGGWHSCALSAAGDVYCWGWNNDGQLADIGHDEYVDIDVSRTETNESNGPAVWVTPTLLKLLSDSLEEIIVAVACGSRHTIIVNDEGVVYGMGCNKFNQLGLKNIENVRKLTSLHTIQNFRRDNLTIKCGPAATAIIM